MRAVAFIALAIACAKRPAPTNHASDAALLEAATVVPVTAPAFASGHTLATWTIERTHDVHLVAIDIAHTRAVVAVGVGGALPRPIELVTVDWTTHATTRVALKNLGEGLSTVSLHDGKRTEHVDFGDPETASEIATYGRALLGAESFDAHVAAAPDAIFLRHADALYRTGPDGTNAQRFGPVDARDAVVSPRGDVVAYVGCDSVCYGAKGSTLRIADVAPPSRERRVAVVNPGTPTFSPNGDVLYVSAWPDPAKPPCFVSVRVATGVVKQLACASLAEPLSVIVAPSGKLAALSAWGGPSGIGDPELTIVTLPSGAVQSRRTLEWSMASYEALTDEGDLLGTTFTNQWGSPGNMIMVLPPRSDRRSGVAAGAEFSVESFAFVGHNKLIVLATKASEGPTYVELAEVPLGPQ